MSRLRGSSTVALAVLLLLGLTAPAWADKLAVALEGQVIAEEPVKGGTQFVSLLAGTLSQADAVGVAVYVIRENRIEEGLFVLLDANEDELYLVGEGELVSETSFEGWAVVVGGTGRYAKATGEASFAWEDLGDGTFALMMLGSMER